MHRTHSYLSRFVGVIILLLMVVYSGGMAAQAQPARSASDAEISATRQQLFKLLRQSPKLTSVVARDSSLMSNQEYVTRNNPALGQFLQQHPEIARNPEFYLFAEGEGNSPEDRLAQVVWPDLPYQPRTRLDATDLIAFMVFFCVLSALMWLLRVLLENRRWGRILKIQTEVHGKLLDRFANNQELLTYMNTDAGKRFLESAPIAAGLDSSPQARMSVMRVLTPLQIGVVTTLVGIGFLAMRHKLDAGIEGPFLVFGTLGLMLGLGFMISAGISFFLARHLGLLPETSANGEMNATLAARDKDRL